MNKKKKGLFYTRYLQKQVYFRKNDVVNALFNLEKYLFENFEFNQDIPISHIKQKWIYDCIRKDDYSNAISSQFKVFSEGGLKKKILSLINTFSQIPNLSETKNFLNAFKKFNYEFNKLLNLESSKNFKTDIYFQILFLFYSKKLKIEENLDGWVAGCDICQDVCPWNKSVPYNNNYETTPKEWIKNLDIESINWDDKTWQENLKGTTLKRIKPWMWKRNIQANLNNKKIKI